MNGLSVEKRMLYIYIYMNVNGKVSKWNQNKKNCLDDNIVNAGVITVYIQTNTNKTNDNKYISIHSWSIIISKVSFMYFTSVDLQPSTKYVVTTFNINK